MSRNTLLTVIAVVLAVCGYEMVIRAVHVTGTPPAVPAAGAALLLATVALAAYLVIAFRRSLAAPATSKAAVVARGAAGAIASIVLVVLLIGVVGHFMTSGSDTNKAADALKQLDTQKQQQSHTQADINAAQKALAASRNAQASTLSTR